MKSPFPGMDPYLERHWIDVHARMIVYLSAQLQPQLGGALRARVEERLVVESPMDEGREIYPDARVFESKPSGRQSETRSSGTEIIEPLVVPCANEERTETFIEIIDRPWGDKLVTVIELLSPSNKLGGASKNKYRQKQEEIYAATVNMVEIDLTRAGRRRFLLPQAKIRNSHRTTFQARVFRAAGKRAQFELYAMPLQQPLAPIKVPLRDGDADVIIDLQPLLERAYQLGAYDDLDYSKPPIPQLNDEDTAWADALLRAAGKRT
jgi:hypothetical protein